MNEFGTHKGVEYEVSSTSRKLKQIYFNNTNNNEHLSVGMCDVTDEKIKHYIDARVLYTQTIKKLLSYFDDKKSVVFRTPNICDTNGEASQMSKYLSQRIKASPLKYIVIGDYKITIYSPMTCSQRKYKAEKQ